MSRKKLQYNYSPKKHVIVEFDVTKDSNNRVVIKNISLTFNFRSNEPKNPILIYDEHKGAYIFGTSLNSRYTNGDFEQIIMRMLRLANEEDQ